MYKNGRSKYRRHKRNETSEKMKFYRHLRSFIIFNIVMAGLWIMGSGAAGLWTVGKIWGIFLAVHYLKINGVPGTKGWLSDDWEAWMEERERRQWEKEPEPLEKEPEFEKVYWQERDLV